MRDKLNLKLHEFTVKTKQAKDDNAAHFELQTVLTGAEEWSIASAGVELTARTGNASVVSVLYQNLATRLPSLRRSIEFKSV